MKKTMLEQALDLIYPPRCPVCHGILSPGAVFVCKKCMGKLPWLKGKTCLRCGKPIYEESEDYCCDCRVEEHIFSQGRAVFLYDEIMRSSIHHFKYLGRTEYAKFYAACAWMKEKEQLQEWEPDQIVPVPLHVSRLRKRGFNQAEIFARALSGYMKVPVDTGCVLRKKSTHAQKDLSPEERRDNLKNAFAPGSSFIQNRRILVVDDIYTTGSTADAVSRVLKDQGAKEIYLLSICIGKGFMVQ